MPQHPFFRIHSPFGLRFSLIVIVNGLLFLTRIYYFFDRVFRIEICFKNEFLFYSSYDTIFILQLYGNTNF